MKVITKAALVKRLQKRNILPNKLVKYDDDGKVKKNLLIRSIINL